MKKILTLTAITVPSLLLLSGCLALDLGGGSKSQTIYPTKGQELIDLQRAKDTGAINDAEYQAQKEKLLAK